MKKIIIIILFALVVAFIKSFVEYKYFSDDKPTILVSVGTPIVAEADTMFVSESDFLVV